MRVSLYKEAPTATRRRWAIISTLSMRSARRWISSTFWFCRGAMKIRKEGQDIWGPASTFCQERRAFLLVDASLAATGVEEVSRELTSLRIGLVKDHSALYWPPLTISAGAGLTKNIDASGSNT